MSGSLRDRIAIVGMGCTKFGENWDASADDMVIDAAHGALASVDGLTKSDIQAFWFSTLASYHSGLPLAKALKVEAPVTRVENFCASGSEAFRNAAFAVAAGVYDVAMAVGVEKLKDSGFSGLTLAEAPGDNTAAEVSNPAAYAMLPDAYAQHYGVDRGQLRDALTHIAWKNHSNGALNELAQYTSVVPKEKIDKAPRVAGELSVFDCSGVADGAAAAIIVRAEDAYKYTDRPMFLKGMSLHAGSSEGMATAGHQHISFPEVIACAAEAYGQAGVTDPARQISMAEVHDCFTPTEMILMEDLGFSRRGEAWKDVLSGRYDLTGELPVNPDGGLKSFGHPVGASGLRMMYELWLQFRGEAGRRQLDNPRLGLAHNMGGLPGEFISFISIFGATLDDEPAASTPAGASR
ncbi:acetyl-CoA acetyltransferase [Mycobacterium sp. NAZ190054]|uniref:acetyl-CoA acetyltransferase n=1 Tax=Mycobacterium sp. NAZ190054 TaxID=1747766 RepID=UPI00079AACAA|nr:acetyl-CoA acetyltransferase [Mycobacterium sp. NAZ190054]KWX57355.1 acetyl-CoA acetyltransferase [Mycobacterium sp. NAZ190054]